MNMREPRLMPVGETGSADVTGMLIDHLDLWTGAVTTKSTAGRGRNGKIELTGIKKLRELILELAVRGKLVEQNPDDEPASVLLERIAEEKARLVKEGKIKKPKKLPRITEEEKPFKTPNGWSWARIWDVSELITSGSRDWAKYYSDSGAIFITMGNLSRGDYKLRLNNVRYVSPPSGGEGARTSLKSGDLVVSITGDVGNLGLIPENFGEAYINQHSCLVRLSSLCRNRYHAEFLRSPCAKQQFDEPQRGVKNSFRLSDMGEMLIPVPPLQEQYRIIEKVDELMALCDRLEQQVGDQLEAHKVLVDTLLDALARSADAADLAESWARVTEHFDTLFTTEASIDKLKQAVLQLAVMGRLVPQDPDDEPASVLLDRIAEEKAQLVKEGKIKKPKKLPDLSEEDKLFDLPKGWTWTHFENMVDPEFTISYGVLVPGPDTKNGIPFVRVADLSISNPSKSPEKTISYEVDQKFAKTRLHGGEILLCVVGSIGKLGVAPNSWKGANIARAICRIMPSKLVSKNYILMLLQTEFMQDRFGKDTRTLAQPTLNVGLIRSATTPLPPLGEQERIVEKVDELMALCDQLKARLGEADETRTHLAEAVVEQAVTT